MTQTPDTSTDAAPAAGTRTSTRSKSSGLSGMLAADLKALAQGMGIPGAGSMKKAQLVEAIKAAQAGQGAQSGQSDQPDQSRTRARRKPATDQPAPPAAVEAGPDRAADQAADRTADRAADQAADRAADQAAESASRPDSQSPSKSHQSQERQRTRTRGQQPQQQDQQQSKQQPNKQQQDQQSKQQDQQPNKQQDQQPNKQQSKQQPNKQQQDQQPKQQDQQDGDDDGQGSRRNRRRRGRDRDRERRPNRNEPDTTVLEDDVLVPAAGILDVLDNYAFVRTSGYLPGTDDVYVSLSMVRRYGLRRGDAIVGQVRQPREGERKEKFNPMVRIDSVNGADPEAATDRPDFAAFTPLHSTDRLRLETTPTDLIGRMIDIAAPIGKGQRGLVIAPPKSGKTMVLQSIASSIAANNPECHLMVLLVDERPEEVTDFQRKVKGEVVASTFDRPASDHTMVAELAIERAKRLVELGHDVVVLLDSITRLARAYNLAAPASGRILSGGVDSSALYPPKKFFGAARNIEDGGSLTIIATALVETDSKMDEVIFEEFKGTGNMELRLRRDLADKRIFPAIDPVESGTRREELLMGEEEQQIVWKLRRHLSGLEREQALELMKERLASSQSNIEFLTQVQKTTP